MRHSKGDRPPRRTRRLPRPVRFVVRLVSTALILALTLAFLPYATRWAAQLWPDPARTTRVSEILRHELNQSARLETMTVDEQGTMTAGVQAALIGEVQRVTIDYDYHASIGVDLEEATVTSKGSVVTVSLPELEILSDALTPTQVDRQDFWYPLTEKRRSQLLAQEKEIRGQNALEEANSTQAQQGMIQHLQKLIQSWIGADTWLVTVQIQVGEEAGK